MKDSRMLEDRDGGLKIDQSGLLEPKATIPVKEERWLLEWEWTR